jgi:hypothetical protein
MADADIGQKDEIALGRMCCSGVARKREPGIALLPDCARGHRTPRVGVTQNAESFELFEWLERQRVKRMTWRSE